MKKFILILSLIFAAIGFSNLVYGHERADNEVLAGKEVWQKFQAKQVECKNLTDEDFHNMGEYFMDLMLGESHEAMNTQMEQMMSHEDEKQMHIVMGKRMSSCDTSAAFPSQGAAFTPMMQMIGMGGFNQPLGMNQMMGGNFWRGWAWFSGFFIILGWALVILGIVALIKYLRK